MSAVCRDCAELLQAAAARCPACGSPRLFAHPELAALAIAHLDCDAFYATVEKRDDPTLLDRPVIVGGARRGVVAAACYVARRFGVRSAMPMFEALRRCPEAVVIPPNMAKYQAVGAEVRAILLSATPKVQPISIDEAFLDLSGTEALHRARPAQTMVRIVRRIEHELGITASVGLSYNKFLAKVASEIDKPRGFAAVGRAEAPAFLAPRPVGTIWGVGPALQRRLAADGISRIGQLQSLSEAALAGRYGAIGYRLFHFARGEDDRRVEPDSETRSVSSETTFAADISAPEALRAALWPLCESVSRRLRRKDLAGRTVVLKLKTARFRTLTRSVTLAEPTRLAERIWQAGLPMLEREANGTAYRLIGIGVSHIVPGEAADPPDLFEDGPGRAARVEAAIESVRDRLGDGAIRRARGGGAEPGGGGPQQRGDGSRSSRSSV